MAGRTVYINYSVTFALFDGVKTWEFMEF